MSLRLKRNSATRSFGALVGATLVVTLAAVMLALFPAVAEAQTGDKSTSSIVVRPGDSLWSISEERLGPNANPQRIVKGTAQIYALNRERIGADPNLILVGQELLVPPTMSERPTGATAAAPKTAEATEAGPRDRSAKSTTGKAPRTAPGGAGAKGGEASETAAEREVERATLPALPDVAVAAPVPTVASMASNDAQPSSVASFLRTVRTEFASAASALAESFFGVFSADARTEERRLLGLGVLVFTLVVAALVAWRLPMRRTTRKDAERWGTSSGYYGYYNGETPTAYRISPFVYHPGSLGGSLGDRDRQDARREAPGAPGRRAVLTGSVVSLAASVVRKAGKADGRGRTPKARAVPRNGLALGAHNPKVRRAPRRVHATMRARKLRPRLRPQRGASRRQRLPVALGQTNAGSNRDGH